MQLPITQPHNNYLVPQRDLHWRQALALVLAGSVIMLVALGLVGWPRLKGTSINYELIRLRQELRELERVERGLVAELEFERSPARLAVRAAELGLAPPVAVEVYDEHIGFAGSSSVETDEAESLTETEAAVLPESAAHPGPEVESEARP